MRRPDLEQRRLRGESGTHRVVVAAPQRSADRAAWFDRASSSSPNDLTLLAALADAQLRSGDRAAAQATLARGLEKDPSYPQLRILARRARLN
jgi:predicted Zn-dependent protease